MRAPAPHRTARRLAVLDAAPLCAVLLGAACSGAPAQPMPIQQAVKLEPFAGCADLEQYIKDTAVRQMRSDLDNEKPGRRGWWGRGVLAEGDAVPGAAASGSSAPAPTAFSTTNVQVKGVDEPDFMKNDGTRIFTLSARTLYATASWPPQSTHLAGSLVIEGYPSSMFLQADRDRVVVLSNVYLPREGVEGEGGGGGLSPPGGSWACWDPGFGWGCGYGANATKVTVVDVKNLEALTVVDEVYLPGNYANARRIGSSVRLVLSDGFRWPSDLKWWPTAPANDGTWWQNDRAVTAAIDALENDNERIIRAYPIDKWLPPGLRVKDGVKADLGYSCSDFYAANAPVRLGFITVATVNLDNPAAAPARTSLVAEQGQVYASATSLYVASWHWWWWPVLGQSDWFYLHKFDIQDPDRAAYVGSGSVEGRINDQFSMDEWNGDLRVATTLSRRVPDVQNPQNTWGLTEVSNRVVVLGEGGGGLRIKGQTEELAPGETIQASRFVGAKGFVVTFRQVDPLFTLDLSDPQNPRKVAALTIPGFSTYIQPIDDTHLLTMGVYLPADAQNHNGWTERRMQLQLFDVGDLRNPKQLFQQTVGSAYGWSEAAWEHKAFNWFPERKLLSIPFSDYLPSGYGNYWDAFVSDLRVFSVDVDKGITPVGALGLKDVYVNYGTWEWSWWWSPWVRRSVMASDADNNDFVYAVADGALRVANARSMDTPLATVLFPPPAPTK